MPDSAVRLRNRQWLLKHRPSGHLTAADFEYREMDVPEPQLRSGQILVRNLMFAPAPTQRNWLNAPGRSYRAAIAVGSPIRGPAGMEILKSAHPRWPAGTKLIGFSPAQQAVIVEEAHKRGKPVQTHATSPEGLRLAVEAGIDLIQHPELHSRDLPDALIKEIVERHTMCGMRANFFTGAAWQRHLEHRADAERRIAKMPPALTGAEKARRLEMLDEQVDIQRRNALKLIAAGCPITPATDSYLGDAPEFRREPKTDEAEPGSGTIRAIEGLVELGMSPMDAIVAATKNGAAANFRSQDLGTIEPGKIADLVLLDADPLTDIHNIEKVNSVIASGNRVDLKSLPEHPLFSPQP